MTDEEPLRVMVSILSSKAATPLFNEAPLELPALNKDIKGLDKPSIVIREGSPRPFNRPVAHVHGNTEMVNPERSIGAKLKKRVTPIDPRL